jgi:NTP pyrophosphatase (non-canonical NTP hydrolase)
MKFINDYMGWVSEFAIYPENQTGSRDELMYLALGAASEAGEIAGKIKKYYRDNVLNTADMVAEIGDVFWYLVMLCNALDVLPSEVLQANYDKLKERAEKNTISGEGDKR